MAQVINTNVMSLNAQRNLSTSNSQLATALQRLSSGLRINSAKDDAAGLAISERFTTQIKGMDVAMRNANDGISLSQTAEGALGQITNNLQRIRELAVQARNATNSASDRAALNQEAQQLKGEIDRVAKQTSFNGVKLLDGSFMSQAFQVGADAGQLITVNNLANVNSADLGTYSHADVTGVAATSFGALEDGDVKINGTSIGAVAADTTAGDRAAGLLNAVNAVSDQTGVYAYQTGNAVKLSSADTIEVEMSGAASTATTGLVGAAADGSIVSTSVDGAATVVGTGPAAATNFADIAAGGITITTGGADYKTAAVVGKTTAAEQLTAVAAAINGATAGTNTLSTVTATVVGGKIHLSGASFTVAVTPNGAASSGLSNIGATTDADGSVLSGPAAFTALNAGDLKINNASIGAVAAAATSAGQAQAVADAINAANTGDSATGVTATVADGKITLSSAGAIKVEQSNNASVTNTGLTTATTAATTTSAAVTNIGAIADGDIKINGFSIGAVAAGADVEHQAINIKERINTETAATGVIASAAGGVITLSSSHYDAFTVTLADSATLANTGLTGGSHSGTEVTTAVADKVGFDKLDISSIDGADTAIYQMDAALNSVNSSRATLGAMQNRFTSVVSSLQTASENLSASRSRIQDADFAQETAAMTRAQILQQAGTAILAQANAVPQNVLSLLR